VPQAPACGGKERVMAKYVITVGNKQYTIDTDTFEVKEVIVRDVPVSDESNILREGLKILKREGKL
jgi:hypothetical protein